MTGVIIKGVGGFYYVKSQDGEVTECRARGIFRKDNIKPMIGDRVCVENGALSAIKPRKNFLKRPPVANIDNLVIVAAEASPDPDFTLIDKMLVNAHISGIAPIICINKIDLASFEILKNTYDPAGYPVIAVSAKELLNTDELLPYLKDKTTAFAGLSGVGKSSILNVLTDSFFETGNISDRIKRGKHTTRHVELTELPGGGFVLDTPGFSSLEIDGIKAEELWRCFPEFDADGCKFKGCSHINEPGCAVKKKLAEKKIPESRYRSYCELYEALKQVKEWEK